MAAFLKQSLSSSLSKTKSISNVTSLNPWNIIAVPPIAYTVIFFPNFVLIFTNNCICRSIDIIFYHLMFLVDKYGSRSLLLKGRYIFHTFSISPKSFDFNSEIVYLKLYSFLGKQAFLKLLGIRLVCIINLAKSYKAPTCLSIWFSFAK